MKFFEVETYSWMTRDSGRAWFQIFSCSLAGSFAKVVNAGLDAMAGIVDGEDLSLVFFLFPNAIISGCIGSMLLQTPASQLLEFAMVRYPGNFVTPWFVENPYLSLYEKPRHWLAAVDRANSSATMPNRPNIMWQRIPDSPMSWNRF